ncbi:hypothetical protein [Xanthobacter versatilis]|uniref:hypothetical protein n=1 Tax=Xanthobacter autotrophicus (strain ATCC BAA-1158 / Py2) TaxID=78245 RepID=UPI00372BA999
MRILKPRYWYPYLRMSHALVDYPIYRPPHLRREADLTDDEAQENFDYFMKVKDRRLEMFLDWMWRKFQVRLSFKPESIDKFDQWARFYNGTIVTEGQYLISKSYQSYNPAWVGQFIGCNLMRDAGIYLGEYLIDKRPMIQWEIDKTYFSKFDVEEYDDELDAESDVDQDVVRYESGSYNTAVLRFPNGRADSILNLQMYNASNAEQHIFIDGFPGQGFYNSARTSVAQALFFHDLAPDSTCLTPDFSTCPIV